MLGVLRLQESLQTRRVAAGRRAVTGSNIVGQQPKESTWPEARVSTRVPDQTDDVIAAFCSAQPLNDVPLLSSASLCSMLNQQDSLLPLDKIFNPLLSPPQVPRWSTFRLAAARLET